jgi:WD40 repeat protein
MFNSNTTSPVRALIETSGRETALGAPLGGLAWLGSGETLRLVTAAGDGHLRTYDAKLVQRRDDAVHDGAVLSFARAPGADRVVTGGDDGRVVASTGAADPVIVHAAGSRWIDHVSTGPGRLIAWSEGRKVIVDTGEARLSFDHPSTAGGVAFDGEGKRLGVAHYGGASIWTLADPKAKPRLLGWKGSHLSAQFAPGGRFLITSMQENSLHGWRLTDAANLRMAGYPTRPKSLSFSVSGLWMASSGAEGVVLWPFKGKDGPMGKGGEVVARRQAIATAVAFHPASESIAAGYSDGAIVVARRGSANIVNVRNPRAGAIAAVAWSGGGAVLAYGTEAGIIGTVDMPAGL